MLKGKVAVVTGAAQGIGRGIADIYAQNGATVAICDMQLEKVKQTAKEISEKYHATVMAEKVDVSNKAEVEAFVRQVADNFGKIDILVNNAGILRMHDVIDVTDEEFDLQINVNLKGTFLFMRAVGNLMKTQRSGKIINIASCATRRPIRENGIYTASKMGVLGLTHVFAAEMGQYGVTCNALLPGMTNTEMVVGNELQKAPGETNHLAQIPLGRMAEVEDHAKVALFLASNLSDYMTGEAVVNSGGRVMTQ